MKLSEWLGEERGRGLTLATAIGTSPVVVSQWSTGQRVPPIERCVPIERATNGAVTRIDLRPDDWRDIWPELDEGQAGTKNIASQWA
jgi:DNA-binding transcriptional regulator YdaS (Cro superfamily)